MAHEKTPPLTQLPFEEEDFARAKTLAAELGYTETVYTSTSALVGLHCLPRRLSQKRGSIIKTKELGFLYVVGEDAILG